MTISVCRGKGDEGCELTVAVPLVDTVTVRTMVGWDKVTVEAPVAPATVLVVVEVAK